jgi:PAS domain S-box-containing protein
MDQPRPGRIRLDDLRAVIEPSPVATLIVDLHDQGIGVANAAAAELLGYPQSAIVGMQPAQLWHGADGRRCRVALSALTGGALDSFRAVGQLQTDQGPVPVSVWAHRMEVVGGSVAVLVVIPDTKANGAVGAFLGPQAVGHDQDPAVLDLAPIVHPDDVDRLLSAIRTSAETAEDAGVRVRLRNAERGWTETRCLFFPSPEDHNRPLGFLPTETAGYGAPGPDAERIASLERQLRRFAAELHAGGLLDARPLVDDSRFAALDQLPRRQREVVDRLLRGERIASIAASMYISASTVRNHLSHSFNEFGVHNQSELLALLRSHSRADQIGELEQRE